MRILLSGEPPAPAADKGAAARIFQLTLVALFAAGLVFLVTADRAQPARTVRPLAVAGVAVVVAVALLLHLEHHVQRP